MSATRAPSRRERARCECENRRERLATIHDEEEVVFGARARVERRGDFRKAPELCAGAEGGAARARVGMVP